MKRIRKLCIIFIMCILSMLLGSCGNEQVENPDAETESNAEKKVPQSMIERGKTEDGVTYEYNKENATLTMSGKIIKGAYPDNYSKDIDGVPEERPWEKWRDEVKEIVLEEGVESVTNMAFTNFRNVEKIVFPKTLKKIGMYAFYGSTREIRKLVLPDSVEEIGWCAFAKDYCYNGIEEIKLPKNLRNIGESAFSAQSFKNFMIPENVESIDKEVFEECNYLETVIIKSKKIKKVQEPIFKRKNVTVYVPKDKVKEYKKWLREAKEVLPIEK